MFSGIVEGLGEVEKIEKLGGGLRFFIDLAELSEGVEKKDSISVNGVCLTVTEISGGTASFDIMPETLDKTDLGELEEGDKVNVERSLKVGDRLGGHFVSGHIDGTGSINRIEKDGEFRKLWFETKKEITEMMIEKGSVALDGVSMTVVDVEEGRFSVCCIPHTLEITTLGKKGEGDKVNIEIDMVGKWVKKILKGMDL